MVLCRQASVELQEHSPCQMSETKVWHLGLGGTSQPFPLICE